MPAVLSRLLTTTTLLVALAGAAASSYAAPEGNVPVKKGQATFKFGDKQYSTDKVTGNFTQSHGFIVVTLVYKDQKNKNEHMNLAFMVQGPGKVDLDQAFGNGIGFWSDDGNIYAYAKGKGQCTMTLTKVTPTAVEGTAECPVLTDDKGKASKPLTGVKFSASTE